MAGKAAIHNIYVNKNADYTLRFVMNTGGNSPVPIDTTSASLKLMVSAAQGTSNILFEASTENGMITVEGTNGGVKILIGPEETSKMAFVEAKYDLIIKLANGRVKRLLEGTFNVRPGISHF